MSTSSPTHTYYRNVVGHWRGVMQSRVTNRKALFAAVGFWNGLNILLMTWWPRWLGRLMLETTVTYDPAGRVEHTTRVYWFRLPMMTSVEIVTLDPDGTHFALEGVSRITLMPWRKELVKGSGSVDPTARHATYCIRWFGAELEQTTDRRDDGVTLRQSAPGFEGTQNLSTAP